MSEKIELRGFIDPIVIQVCDAIQHATGQSRMAVLEPILIEWAEKEIHKATVILNLTKDYGNSTETKGSK